MASTSSISSGCIPTSSAVSAHSSGFSILPRTIACITPRTAEYLDRNYGGILIVWDRLFGTFAAERPEAPLVYGLAHPLGSLNPITIALHEWLQIGRDFRRARSWRQRLRQLFGRPGEGLAELAAGHPPSFSTGAD